MNEVADWAEKIRENVRKVIYGKDDVVDLLLVALVSGGHALLEDVPGVGKTILARALAASLGFRIQRLQCTPDLMPADVIGVSVYNQRSSSFEFHDGPIMTNILLVDEINRASPRTQSALLEAMEEGAITVEGNMRPLPRPFFIIATENPVEFEGTFPLPVAQKDRFFLSASMGYPSPEAEKEIMEAQRRTTHPIEDLRAVSNTEAFDRARRAVDRVAVAPAVESYILDLVEATRHSPAFSLGASPRAARALYRGAKARAAFAGQDEALVEDVQALVPAVLWKRVSPATDSLLRGVDERRLIEETMRQIAAPESSGSRS